VEVRIFDILMVIPTFDLHSVQKGMHVVTSTFLCLPVAVLNVIKTYV